MFIVKYPGLIWTFNAFFYFLKSIQFAFFLSLELWVFHPIRTDTAPSVGFKSKCNTYAGNILQPDLLTQDIFVYSNIKDYWLMSDINLSEKNVKI